MKKGERETVSHLTGTEAAGISITNTVGVKFTNIGRDEGVEETVMEAPGVLTVNDVTGLQIGLRVQLMPNWPASSNVGPDAH